MSSLPVLRYVRAALCSLSSILAVCAGTVPLLSLPAEAAQTLVGQSPVSQPPDALPVPQGPESIGDGATSGPALPVPSAPQPLDAPQGPEPMNSGALSAPMAPLKALSSSAMSEPERPKSEKPIDQLSLSRGAILLPKGMLQVEPFADYTRISSDRVAINGFSVFEAIVVGTIRVDRVFRDIYTTGVNVRYGLLNRLQLEARVPYVYRQDRELTGIGTTQEADRTIHHADIGDVEGSLVYQAVIGTDVLPDVLLRLKGRVPTGTDSFEVPTTIGQGGEVRLLKTPTGNGFYTVAPGIQMVWRTDPVVYYVGGNLLMNLERNVGGAVGIVTPGNTTEFFFGLNLSVSERVSLNMTFYDSWTDNTRQNGRRIAGTSFNSGLLLLGTALSLNPTTTLLVTGGIGITKESPDFQLVVSLPLTFRLPSALQLPDKLPWLSGS